MAHGVYFRACEAAMELLKQGANASDAVARAITVLEDDPTTNAGRVYIWIGKLG